jgi:hypothetical protein
MLYTFIISPRLNIRPANSIILNCSVLIVLCEKYKLQTSSLRNFP